MKPHASLVPPPDPPEPPPLEGPSGTLAHVAAATRRPFVLSAPRSRAEGDELAGISLVEADGHPLLHDLRPTDAGPASNVVVSPREIRREMVAGGRTLVETVVLPERSPGVVAQWTPGPGASATLSLRFRLPDDARRFHRREGTVRTDGKDGAVRLIHVAPAPVAWTFGEEGPTTVAVRVEAPAGRAVTLLAVQAKDLDRASAALSATARARVHEVRAERALASAVEERFALRTGVPDLDEPLLWAVARLEAAPDALADPMRGALLALGRAAAGLHDLARRSAAAVARDDPWALVAAGWVTGWTGSASGWRPADLRERASAILPATRAGPSRERAVARAAVTAAADLLDALGDRAGGDRLRAALPVGPIEAEVEDTAGGGPRKRGRNGSSDPGQPAAKGLSLPVLGAGEPAAAGGDPANTGRTLPPAAVPELVLAAVLGVPTLPPPAPPSAGSARPVQGPAVPERPAAPATGEPTDAVGAGLAAWARFARERPDEGYLRLRDYLARGFTDATGCWRRAPDHPELDDPGAAALVPLLLLHGLLGARPDAPFGRLRLAPALPSSWTSFRATGIRLGEVTLELSCRSSDGRHTFVLRPTAGAVPPNLVFQPAVAGRVEAVDVDGERAEVEPERTADRWRVSLQMPLDRERRVTLVESRR